MPHFLAQLLARATGLELQHVPFRGGNLAMQAVAGGQVAAALATESSALALEQAGKLRVLATSGTARSPFLPKAPTFAEFGLNTLTQREWFGLFMPAKAAPAQVSATAEVVQAMLAAADVRETWHKLGLLGEHWSPVALTEAMRREHGFWAEVVKASGFTPEA
jgi:tripartite-type tricarboxylate transporter receptor subunit TctC